MTSCVGLYIGATSVTAITGERGRGGLRVFGFWVEPIIGVGWTGAASAVGRLRDRVDLRGPVAIALHEGAVGQVLDVRSAHRRDLPWPGRDIVGAHRVLGPRGDQVRVIHVCIASATRRAVLAALGAVDVQPLVLDLPQLALASACLAVAGVPPNARVEDLALGRGLATTVVLDGGGRHVVSEAGEPEGPTAPWKGVLFGPGVNADEVRRAKSAALIALGLALWPAEDSDPLVGVNLLDEERRREWNASPVQVPTAEPVDETARIHHFDSITAMKRYIESNLPSLKVSIDHDRDDHLVLRFWSGWRRHTVPIIHFEGEGAYLVKLPREA